MAVTESQGQEFPKKVYKERKQSPLQAKLSTQG